MLVFLSALAGVIAGGGYLFYYVSKNPVMVSPPAPASAPKPAPAPAHKPVPAPKSVQPAERLAEREKMEAVLAEFLRLKGELDEKGADTWGMEDYKDLVQLGLAADAFLADGSYAAASDKYGEAVEKARGLIERTGAIRDAFLSQGTQALDAGNGKDARRLLQMVLKIDPKNSLALKLFPKAESIERVTALVASGNQHAQKGALSEAKKDYQKALELDPASGPAQTGLNQIDRRIADKQFRQHMSSGMAALDNGKYYAAQDAFIKAKNIKPDASEVRDALNQVDAAIRLKLIDNLKKEAAATEQAENWSGALEGYTAVLKIDGSLRFALEGKSRSLERSLIDKRLQYYLETPDILASDQYLQKAVGLVENADAAEPKGPRIRAQIEKLKNLIRVARTPIKIVIASDNTTEVAIFKVGKFGRFQKKELHLRPGTYTVVGVREGYRDVRQKMVVRADGPPLQVIIRCEERI